MRGPLAMWKQLLVSALLLGGAAALWFGQDRARDWLGHAAQPASTEARQAGTQAGVPVIVAPVTMASDDLVVEVVGTGRAQRSVTLQTETTGKIVEMALAPGRRFAAGDVLLRLDDTAQRLALALAETRLAEAERVLARYERLEGTGAATPATLDERATAAELARIEVEQAREALADRTLRAPFDGVSGLPEVEIGERIESGDAIASLDDRSVLLVAFDLPEALLARIEPGMPVTARTPAVPDGRYEGEVSAIDSRIEVATRTARVRVAIPNEDDSLRPGASFTVRLELPGDSYPLVPELAVQFSRGSLHVWRVSADKAERVEVELVRRRAGAVLVDGPLREGDRVVIEGTQRLAPGKVVDVIGGGDTS
ncbi:MAG TPA: efflux RND transporter periplasmic adaptor subunit [Thermohalobaculum sp.]|nr:efflux RND transporter periplasmic adaptor subunit [Thermohalobaculum sp.]